MSEEIRIPIAWGSLAALASGPVDGKKFLFLHGWLDNAASFTPLLSLLPTDWRCVALDLPGHGHSDHRPAGTAYHLVDAVIDVLSAADSLGWDRFTLVGHSLGAGVASALAGSFSTRLEGLVLIEGIGPFSATAAETPLRLAEYYTALSGLRKKRLPIYPNLEQATRARMQAGAIAAAGARLMVERGSRSVEGGVTWRSDPRLRLATLRFTEDQVEAFLRAIACPTLCIVAKEGLVARFANWRQRAEWVAHATVAELSGEHHLHLDSPEPTALCLGEWYPPDRVPTQKPRYLGN